MKTNTARRIPSQPKMSVNPMDRHTRSAVWTACWLAGLTATSLAAHAAPLTLATVPAGSGGREPAPNVIVSVDNSGSMGNGSTVGSKMYILKDALRQTFAAGNVADERIRLAWLSMWNCRAIPKSGAPCNNLNGMKRLKGGIAGDGTHRGNFLTWVNTLTGVGMTPSHLTFKAAGDYLSAPYTIGDVNSPWASDPSVTELPIQGCRRSFQIFLTDGEWNQDTGIAPNSDGDGVVAGGGNADGTAFTFPTADPGLVLPADTPASSATYPVTGDQTRATRDAYGSASLSTLADLAFYYWSRDLQAPVVPADPTKPGIPNLIKPLYKDKNPATVGATTLQPFWNLKNNPATWQNLTNYTIGFGTGADWSTAPDWTGDTWGGTGYTDLVNGIIGFGNPISGTLDSRRRDLWHMALNSRGRYVYANTSAQLVTAFQDILDNILADTTTPFVSISASSSSLRTDSNVYIAEYAGATWAGNVKSYAITSGTGDVGATAVWRAAKDGTTPYGLDLLSNATGVPNRVILSHDGTSGVSFTYATLSTTQKALLRTGPETAADGTNRVNFVRGDTSLQVPAGPYRVRSSRLGDIVSSNIWYVGKPSGGYADTAYATFRSANAARTPVIYVGANDGMLHGFQASDGAEKLAYVPKGVLSKFVSFSSPSYTHKYFVDGQPFSGDADLGGADGWKTLLVSGLGGGGKGYFILDITNPATFTTTNAAAIVKIDTTDSNDPDLGYMYSPAVVDDGRADKSGQIVKMNDGRWAVVMGNGYNSTNERPVLTIQYLDGSWNVVRIAPTCASSCPGFIGNGNGLSAPRLLDLNGDGKVDVAYAGDLQGNLWKFDLTSATSSNWKVAFALVSGSSTPYFVAKSSGNVRQPIVSAPYAMVHPKGGIMLAFGTGRNVTDLDPGSVSDQTMWGVWDNSTIAVTASAVTFTDPSLGIINAGTDTTRPTTLVQQTYALAGTEAILPGETVGRMFFDVSRNGVVYTNDATTKRGWYLDWPTTVPGLRVLHNPMLFKGERILVQSTVPQSGSAVVGETCTPTSLPESTFISVFNMFSGNPSQTQVFTPISTSIPVANLGIAQISPGDFSRYISDGNVRLIGPKGRSDLKTGEGMGLRANWREYQ